MSITASDVNTWIATNVLDTTAWDKNAGKQAVGVTQATRNLERWYPDTKLTTEVVAHQAIWELQGLDPALKFQKQGVKQVGDRGEMIQYGTRAKIAPEVVEILGGSYIASSEDSGGPQFGGCLV